MGSDLLGWIADKMGANNSRMEQRDGGGDFGGRIEELGDVGAGSGSGEAGFGDAVESKEEEDVGKGVDGEEVGGGVDDTGVDGMRVDETRVGDEEVDGEDVENLEVGSEVDNKAAGNEAAGNEAAGNEAVDLSNGREAKSGVDGKGHTSNEADLSNEADTNNANINHVDETQKGADAQVDAATKADTEANNAAPAIISLHTTEPEVETVSKAEEADTGQAAASREADAKEARMKMAIPRIMPDTVTLPLERITELDVFKVAKETLDGLDSERLTVPLSNPNWPEMMEKVEGNTVFKQPPRMPLHEAPGLCQWVLSNITASAPLEIKQSVLIIPNTCIHQQTGGPARTEHYRTQEFRHTGPDCNVGTHSGLFVSGADKDFVGVLPGEEIYRATPTMWAVASQVYPAFCNYCFGDENEERTLGGRKRTKGPVQFCGKCKIARFCSRDCMRNAWQEWHKDECRVLRERPGISPTALLVHRLIFWQRRKRLSVGELTCLQRLGGNFEEWVKEPIQAKRLQDEAVDIWKTAGGEEPLSLPWRLLRVLTCNLLPLRAPSNSNIIGRVLELVGAQINHSCEPNAFMIFEGGEVQVRSLRKISPGEEITMCYCESTLGMPSRLDAMMRNHAFPCQCNRCQQDLYAQRIIRNTSDSVHRFYQAHVELLAAVQPYTQQSRYSADTGWVRQDVAALEARVEAIRASVPLSPTAQPWPDDLEPLPIVRQKLAMLYLEQGQPLPALRCALLGCLVRFHRHGPEWINSMRDVMVPVLLTVGAMPPDAAAFRRDRHWDLTRSEIQAVTYGYIHELARQAAGVFGITSEYAGTMMRLMTVLLSVRQNVGNRETPTGKQKGKGKQKGRRARASARDAAKDAAKDSPLVGRYGVRIGTRRFVDEEFKPAEKRLLAWAGVPPEFGAGVVTFRFVGGKGSEGEWEEEWEEAPSGKRVSG